MLYDPNRWDSKKNAKDDAEVFSLHGLIAWLETKNPGGKYNFHDCHGSCLLDQYLGTSLDVSADDDQWIDDHFRVCGGIDRYITVAMLLPHTYGAALRRARKIAESA